MIERVAEFEQKPPIIFELLHPLALGEKVPAVGFRKQAFPAGLRQHFQEQEKRQFRDVIGVGDPIIPQNITQVL